MSDAAIISGVKGVVLIEVRDTGRSFCYDFALAPGAEEAALGVLLGWVRGPVELYVNDWSQDDGESLVEVRRPFFIYEIQAGGHGYSGPWTWATRRHVQRVLVRLVRFSHANGYPKHGTVEVLKAYD